MTLIGSFTDLLPGNMNPDGSDFVIDDLSSNTITLKQLLLGDVDAAEFIF